MDQSCRHPEWKWTIRMSSLRYLFRELGETCPCFFGFIALCYILSLEFEESKLKKMKVPFVGRSLHQRQLYHHLFHRIMIEVNRRQYFRFCACLFKWFRIQNFRERYRRKSKSFENSCSCESILLTKIYLYSLSVSFSLIGVSSKFPSFWLL